GGKRNGCERGVGTGQLAAAELDTQSSHILADRHAVLPVEFGRQVDGVHAGDRGQFGQFDPLVQARLEKLAHPLEPGRGTRTPRRLYQAVRRGEQLEHEAFDGEVRDIVRLPELVVEPRREPGDGAAAQVDDAGTGP